MKIQICFRFSWFKHRYCEHWNSTCSQSRRKLKWINLGWIYIKKKNICCKRLRHGANVQPNDICMCVYTFWHIKKIYPFINIYILWNSLYTVYHILSNTCVCVCVCVCNTYIRVHVCLYFIHYWLYKCLGFLFK